MQKILTLTWLFLFTYCGLSFAVDRHEKIYLIASSTQYNERVVPAIIKMLKGKGYEVDTQYLDQRVSDLGYVNTDSHRAKQLIAALKDNQVKYLWFVRGGGGAFNLMPQLYLHKDEIRQANPKLIIGFSDVTAVHYFVNKHLGWPSIHGVVAAYNKDLYSDNPELNKEKVNIDASVDDVFLVEKNGVDLTGLIPLNEAATHGAVGSLHGGNLTLLQSFFSTKYEKSVPNEILAIEGVGIKFRHLDRILHQLEYKNDFHPKAIIFGQFYPDSATDEQRLIYKTVIERFAARVPFPVFYYPYFGHGATNNPLIFSAPVTINCVPAAEDCRLIQPGLTVATR